MSNVKQQLEVPSIPSLGFAPAEYERRYFAENNGALNVYFRRLISTLGALFGPQGGKFLNTPHGAFHDSADQVAANTTTAFAVTFNATDISNGVSITSNSRITVAVDGIWNLQFSLQFKNTSNDGQDFDVWFRKNDVNIDNSNSRFHISARKSSGNPSHLIASLNFFASLVKDDYLEIMWNPTSTDVSLEHFDASASPTRPVVPSAIATLTFVSNLPTI